MRLLPEGAPARAALHQAHACDRDDLAAVRQFCVPWVIEPATVLEKETAHVRRQAYSMIAAYLVMVGASLSVTAIPFAHTRALRLPQQSRLRRFCGEELQGVCVDESDDEIWLRDDVPSEQWLTGASEHGDRDGTAAACWHGHKLPRSEMQQRG